MCIKYVIRINNIAFFLFCPESFQLALRLFACGRRPQHFRSSDTSDTSQSDCSISGRPVLWSDLVLPGSAETSQVEEKLQVPADPVHSRKLKESGRQNSSDSGIATGSFSSYSGSLDAAGPGEEYSALFNLPEKHLCSCSSCPVHEYQVPSSRRFLYDSPRSLLEGSRHRSTSQDEPCSESPSQSDSELDKGEGHRQGRA